MTTREKFLEDLKLKYEHCDFTFEPNKCKMKKNVIELADVEVFNSIYNNCRSFFWELETTPSGGMPYSNKVRYKERFIVHPTKTAIELVLVSLEGCFRFLLRLGKLAEDNTVTGTEALKAIYGLADEFGVLNTFKENMVSKEEGLMTKNEIESPMISVVKEEYIGQEFDNVHHLDLNSSYASRICEEYPELRPMYNYIYSKRKEDDGYYKHVLTNSIGAMQSKYCLDIESRFFKRPYGLSIFAKTAINGNNEVIRQKIAVFKALGITPLLINTDGLWYQGDIYHDKDEGTSLGQWKNDHTDCRIYIKSSGAYQYIENGKVKSVVRGTTALDRIKPDRDTWNWREIDNYPDIDVYKFVKGLGVIKTKVRMGEEDLV